MIIPAETLLTGTKGNRKWDVRNEVYKTSQILQAGTIELSGFEHMLSFKKKEVRPRSDPEIIKTVTPTRSPGSKAVFLFGFRELGHLFDLLLAGPGSWGPVTQGKTFLHSLGAGSLHVVKEAGLLLIAMRVMLLPPWTQRIECWAKWCYSQVLWWKGICIARF